MRIAAYGDIDDRVRTIATALELGAFIWSAVSQYPPPEHHDVG
jgi:hypothetical protein